MSQTFDRGGAMSLSQVTTALIPLTAGPTSFLSPLF